VLALKDALGNDSVHTIYVTGESGVKDVDAEIARIKADTDSAAAEIAQAFAAAGWQPNGV
jgi:hypothetical protein